MEYFGRRVLGKVLILPKKYAEQFTCDKPWACISVSDSHTYFNAEISEENRVGILRLKFDDVERACLNTRPIELDQCKQIVEFVDKFWPNIDLLMIHCNAGMSRSPAIGKYISEKYEPDQVQYYSRYFCPNKLVYESLKSI